ncbi:MAG: Glu-tRNA(Gln) amidotransferase subunit GatD [Candidatus Woesearchaeota archaeon]
MTQKSAQPGDTIEITYEGKTLKGMLMPRVHALSQDIVVLKLDNGYNVGIAQKRISTTKVVSKYVQPKNTSSKKVSSQKLPKVAVLSFGGTISSKIDYRTGGVFANYTAEDFVAMAPELEKTADIEAVHVMSEMSEDMSYEGWKKIAETVHAYVARDDIAGVVATVGTDTLHYITSAVSFFLNDLNKPVIFTASQRSIDRGSSDAFMNLACSVHAAASFDGAVVASCMHATTHDDYCFLIRGTKVRKMHTSRRDAFRAINEKPLAKVFPDGKIEVINNNYTKRSNSKCTVDTRFEEKIAIVLAYPGQDSGIIDYYVNKGSKGIVIAGTALGHVITKGKYSLLEGISRAVKKGIPVIISTQTIYGRTHPHVYTNLRKLSLGAGCIYSEDMLLETAYVKLGWVLAHVSSKKKQTSEFMKEISKQMLTNMRGEINERHTVDDFLN